MQFLLKTMTHRPSDTNVPVTIQPEVATPEATDDLEHSEDDLTELQIEESEFPIPASPSTPRTEKRKRPDMGADKIITFMKQKHDQKMELKQTKKPVDGVDLFLASVAQSMRKLPRRQLHKAKVAILNVIAAAEDESEWEAAASPVSSNSPSNNSASMNITMIRPSTAVPVHLKAHTWLNREVMTYVLPSGALKDHHLQFIAGQGSLDVAPVTVDV
ncbi:uncharacterized protein LOC124355565 [Homalodisca vitripennis]|uniref:uncharacterized protein LOC124355565 n=1 Tax=Homalodisca vitripennis TaxID=197043 RepID=UPI001EEBC283|nr:uncharacterized protein LOC124355565 [Homalodisca vitripennis]